MQKETWDELRPNAKVSLKSWTERRLVGVDGTPLRVYGAADVELTLRQTVSDQVHCGESVDYPSNFGGGFSEKI